MSDVPIRPALPVRPGSVWENRLSSPGWLLLPLRAFLGITFCYAGLQKLANPAYLNPHSPTSVASQLHLLRNSSPIGPLLGLSQHAPTLVGLLIALGELAVGVGTLLGIYARLAAVGGALLSLTFFLTVSWNTTPYYYGSDIVFAFAWLTLAGFGTGNVLSLDTWIASRVRRSMRSRSGRVPPRQQAELERRTVLRTGAAAAAAAVVAALLATLTAVLGRAARGTRRSGISPGAPTAAGTTPGSAASNTPAAPGNSIGAAGSLPVGQAKPFTDPASGDPAWVVHSTASSFVAFSAVCTHAGCAVQYDPSSVQFVCPCHGGVYDARTGAVLQGPPPAPLAQIPVHVVSGQLRVGG